MITTFLKWKVWRAAWTWRSFPSTTTTLAPSAVSQAVRRTVKLYHSLKRYECISPHVVSSGFSKLQRLKKLSLNGNQLTSLDSSVLDQLPQLCFLSVEDNSIASLHGIRRARALLEFYICNNCISMSKDIYCLKVTKGNNTLFFIVLSKLKYRGYVVYCFFL